ncbi:GNAT family N-acetyltransferase [Micropruina sp.]|uniref:GNAT family N-acetyltransferase n=1 Tax=Micropruina sp. TaxID=2737536 RepID=UPI0039E55BC3
MGQIRAMADDEIETVLDLITAEQADPSTGTCYIGTTRAELRLELEELDGWPARALVAIDDGLLVGATIADVDTELGRSWIFGPWVPGEAWHTWARPLLEAAIEGCPAEVTNHEISADVVNRRLAELAAGLGWKTSVPNHVFRVTADTVTGWPADDPRVRPPRSDDFAAVDPLHALEFPDTYLTTGTMLAEGTSGERIVAVSEADDGRVVGYASGRVQPDGSGYLDFIAITPDARGTGAGLGLLVTVGRRIVERAPQRDVNLTVQHHRAPAIALYRRLGFTLETTIVGYSSPALSR